MKDIDEYEYWVSVPAADVPVVVAALGAHPVTTSSTCWSLTARRS